MTHIVRAEVLPITGKHYKTDVQVLVQGHAYHIEVSAPLGDPSEEQLAYYDYTPEQWEDNALVDDGWGGKEHLQRVFNWDHYQSRFERFLADRISAALDGLEWEFIE